MVRELCQGDIAENTLYVYPTARSVREFLNNPPKLTHIITIKEFFENATFVRGRVALDRPTRTLLLSEAIRELPIERVGFSRNFLDFLEHSEFIFKFFDELNSEFVPFESLRLVDTYAQFEEHLSILEAIKDRYEKIIDERGFYDPSNIRNQELNSSYFERFLKVYIKTVGYLTKKELKIIEMVSQVVPLSLEINIDKYNKKMLEKLKNEGFEIDGYGLYLLEFDTKSSRKLDREPTQSGVIHNYSFSQKISQYVYLFKLLKDVVDRGVDLSRVAVIACDESAISMLKGLDFYNNLNFAMGFPLQKSAFFKKVERLSEEEGDDFFTEMEDRFGGDREFDTIRETLFLFRKILSLNTSSSYPKSSEEPLFNLSQKELIKLFIKEIKRLSIDDNRGGKVRVMGLLEARNYPLDVAILLDFNDSFFPSKSEKDLFLNSELKSRCGIPTPFEREELQMHFLQELINNTKEIDILYVKNDDLQPSRYLLPILSAFSHHPKQSEDPLALSQKGINTPLIDEHRMNALFFGKKEYNIEDIDPVVEIDLQSEPISHTKLKEFLTCKRRFYYRYIKNIKEPQSKGINQIIGERFHTILKNFGSELPTENRSFYDALSKGLKNKEDSATTRFAIDLFLMECKGFIESEIRRQKEGFRVLYTEKEFFFEFEGFKFTGSIDRVDEREGEYFIIDYKTGKNIKIDSLKSLQKSVDFQLPLYYKALMREGIEAKDAYFYAVREGKLHKEQYLKEKLEILPSLLEPMKAKEITFKRCDKKSICRLCPYKVVCGRG